MQPNLLRNLSFLPTKKTKYRTFYRTHFLLISITCLSRYISLSFYRPALVCVCVALLAACITASLCNGVWSFWHSSLQQLFWVRVSSFILWGSVSCMLLFFFCITCIICYKIHIKICVVKRLIAINRIQNKSFCLHNMCVCVRRMVYRNIWMHVCEFIYIYINSHTCIHIFLYTIRYIYIYIYIYICLK